MVDTVNDEVVNYFKEKLICDPPAVSKEELDKSNPPAILKALWAIGSKWHQIEKSFDVFGFNLLKMDDKDTLGIFGDEDIRTEWAEEQLEHGNITCASEGWVVIVAFSEYDYLLCCLDRDNEAFGQVRHIVNNCSEERECCMIHELFDHVLDFLSAAEKKKNGDKVPEDKSLNQALSNLRHSIVSAVEM